MNRDSQAYWNKRAATFTRDATVEYERWLLDLLALCLLYTSDAADE